MKTHPFDPLSFVAGLLFTVLGVAGAAGVLDDVERLRIGWPLLLVVFGVLLVASAIAPSRARRAVDSDDLE
jgi:membrane protein implicated in regulation of membrane protease activity